MYSSGMHRSCALLKFYVHVTDSLDSFYFVMMMLGVNKASEIFMEYQVFTHFSTQPHATGESQLGPMCSCHTDVGVQLATTAYIRSGDTQSQLSSEYRRKHLTFLLPNLGKVVVTDQDRQGLRVVTAHSRFNIFPCLITRQCKSDSVTL